MFENEKFLSLSDLIDIKLLQEFQDTFAKAMDVASLTVDNKGPITRPSNFSDFCTKYTRGSKLGLEGCVDCDIKWGKIAAERGEPVIYTCHTGLTDFAVPIIVGGRHIGSILGGQVLTEPPNEEYFRQVARKLGIDEDEYILALNKIKVVSLKNIEAAARLLFIVANAISEIGHKNLELFNKNKSEGLYKIIMRTIRATLDIKETKKRIINIVGQTLGADRCFIVEYDKKADKFLPVKDEYISASKIKSYIDGDVNNDFPKFAETIKNGKNIIINNNDNLEDDTSEIFKIIEAAAEKYDIKSAFVFPLYYGEEILGALNIHYVNDYHYISKEELSLINTVANQIVIAIHQSELYNALKLTTANQNAILNNIPFMAWLKDDQSRLLAVNEAFANMCDAKVERIIGKTDYDFFPKEHAELYIKEDILAMEKGQTIITEDLISGPDGVKYHETFKSPVFDKKGNVIGTVGIARDVTEKKESDLELTRRQEQILKAVEREKLIGNVISKAVNAFDISQIKHIVTEIGKITKADRCFFVQVDPSDAKRGKPIEFDAEYLSSPDIKSIYGYTFPHEDVGQFVELYLTDRKILTFDFDEIKQSKAPNHKKLIKYFELFGAKSSIGVPLFYKDKFMALLCIEFIKEKVIPTEDELNFLKIVSDQLGMAVNQIQLYQNTKKTAEREKALRQIVSSSVQTFDFKTIIKSIITETGKLYNADRCFFIARDIESDLISPIEYYAEYRSSDSIKSHLERQATNADIQDIAAMQARDEIAFVENTEQVKMPKGAKRMLVDDLSVKSYMTIPIMYGEINYGVIVLHYVNDFMQFSEDDIEIAKAISNQSAIVIHQSRLYKQMEAQAEREKLLREISSAVGSTIDFNDIRKKLVSLLGHAINSDLTILYIQDPNTEKFVNIDEFSVHLSSDKIKNPVGENIAEDYGWADYIRNNKKTNVAYSDIEDLKKDYDLFNKKPDTFLNLYKIKSIIGVPIEYADTFLGFLVLNFITKPRTITQDDVNLVRTVASQAGIALYQSRLYIQAQEVARSKGEFIANMSHEIKTPLNIIIGFSDILTGTTVAPAKQVEYLKNINKSGRHLLNLTNDIINISKMESGNFKLDYEIVDSSELIVETASSLSIFAQGKDISIDMNLVDAKIMADKKMLTQIMYNLLSNAIKFTPENGNVKITSSLDNEKLIVSIEDTGIGIDVDSQEMIFEKFKQVDSSFERRQQGAGLGLSIAKQLIELHNGAISVESSKGNGSRFWFVLPVAKK